MIKKTLLLLFSVLSCELSWANYQADENAAWKPTHKLTKLIQLKSPPDVHGSYDFCLGLDGNLIVARQGKKTEPAPNFGAVEAGVQSKDVWFSLIQIYRPDFELQLELTLDFPVLSLTSDRAGNFYVGGQQVICKYSPTGELLKRFLPPNLAELTPDERIAIAREKITETCTKEQLAKRGPPTEEEIQEKLNSLGQVCSIAAIGDELFVAVPSLSGVKELEIWRFNSLLQEPIRIIERLSTYEVDQIHTEGKHLILTGRFSSELSVYNRAGELLPARELERFIGVDGLQAGMSIQRARLTTDDDVSIYAEPSKLIHRFLRGGVNYESDRFIRCSGLPDLDPEFIAFDEARNRVYLLGGGSKTVRIFEPVEQKADPQVVPLGIPPEQWAREFVGEWVMIAEEEISATIDPQRILKRISFSPEGKLLLKLPGDEELQEFGTVQMVNRQYSDGFLSVKKDQAEVFRLTLQANSNPDQFQLGISFCNSRPFWLGTIARQAK